MFTIIVIIFWQISKLSGERPAQVHVANSECLVALAVPDLETVHAGTSSVFSAVLGFPYSILPCARLGDRNELKHLTPWTGTYILHPVTHPRPQPCTQAHAFSYPVPFCKALCLGVGSQR